MEDLTPCASSSLVVPLYHKTSPTVQQLVHSILQALPENWAYSIFWQPSRDDDGRLVLTWVDGHFRGTTWEGMFADSCDIGDPEWYYIFSVTRSYSSEDGILGRAFRSGGHIWLSGEVQHEREMWECDEKIKEARMHGIQTILCIAIPNGSGVLELGSSQIIQEDWSLVHLAKSLFFCPFSNPDVNSRAENPSDEANGEPALVGARKRPYTESIRVVPHDISKKSGKKKTVDKDDKELSLSTFLSGPLSHVEAERQRRGKMNRQFYALRSVVPSVSGMDKASLLADAVDYIKQLQYRIDALESKLVKFQHSSLKRLKSNRAVTSFSDARKTTSLSSKNSSTTSAALGWREMLVDVKVLGQEAVVPVWSSILGHPCARLMDVLKELGLMVQHASVSCVKGTMLQDVVIRTPVDCWVSDESMRNAIRWKLGKM